ncbi:MAG: hypothetical protein OXC72_00895 [Roseovarius sp.]|nr:hypothetical protein [Roseovarius sp.]
MTLPPEHARHWTVRVKTFKKVPRDPRLEIRVRDVVGPQVDPPDPAVVPSGDEKRARQRGNGRREERGGRFR